MRVECGRAQDLLLVQPNDSVDLVYVDPPFFTQKDRGDFDDRWASVEAYAYWFGKLTKQFHRVLRPTGSLLVHVDYRAAAYLKVEIDKTFGYGQYRNEIVWGYNSGGASRRHLSRKHDTLHWWSKSDSYTFNVLREPYATGKVEGRKGFHPDGRMLTDVWLIPFLSTSSLERTGYDSQKPERLLSRVIEVFTDPGDTVLDPMCGSGTTGVAATKLNRRCILMDENPQAISIAKKRLKAI